MKRATKDWLKLAAVMLLVGVNVVGLGWAACTNQDVDPTLYLAPAVFW